MKSFYLQTLSVTDDTVLEEHNEDPMLIQMHLIDDGGKLSSQVSPTTNYRSRLVPLPTYGTVQHFQLGVGT